MASTARPSDKELREMAKRAQVARQRGIDLWDIAPLSVAKALVLVLAAALASYVSQLSLAPVYGSIPSALYHNQLSNVIFLAAWVGKAISPRLPFNASTALPAFAAYVPGVLHHIFRYSGAWGAQVGPVVTELITFYPILFMSSFEASRLVTFNNALYDAVPAGLTFALFSIAKSVIPDLLGSHIGSAWIVTRCGLWNIVGALYAIVSPSLLLLAAVPALVHTSYFNSMCTLSPSLNESLALSNHTLLARTESITGYVSVLDNFDSGYRILRCDHSLLGGEWQRAPKGFETNITEFKEPIYAIFVTMEAVRLLEPPPKNPNPRALAIGLGIGTSTDAMIKHGVQTDIVELDPAVYRYAMEYFGLSKNHTAYIEDAVGFVKRETAKKQDGKKYEFILHDVFTGGAVPTPLFTLEFFLGLQNLLTDDGIIAINWAGDLKLDAARSIIETIKIVFNNCRAFREDAPPEDDKDKQTDFTNVVIFCTRSAIPYTFRRPTESDVLGSIARRRFLYPRYEIDLRRYWADLKTRPTILQEDNIGELVEWQKKSALGHWAVIRTVVPDAVWENY